MALAPGINNRSTNTRVRGIVFALCTLLPLASPALAQTPPDKSDAPLAATPALATPDAPIELPDTPAGRALKSFLGSIAVADALMTEQQFSPEFIKAVPMEKFEKITADLRAQNGELVVRSIEPGATAIKLTVIARGTKSRKSFRIPITTDEKGVIQGLFIGPAPTVDTPPLKSWDDLDTRLKPLAELVSFAAYELPAERQVGESTIRDAPRAIHELNAGASLAVGSTFKLYILGALTEKMLRGEATWDTELPIEDRFKSLPSGTMQNEKAGTQFTIKQYALKMISISDNTAADHLLYFVGRDRVEEFFKRISMQPALKTLPFLGTREMFAIKLAQDRTLGERYAKASIDQRRAMLAPPKPDAGPDDTGGEVYATTPNIAMAAFWSKPTLIDKIEWFTSTHDACIVMDELQRNMLWKTSRADLAPLQEVLGTNPGIPLSPKVWKRFFYKGGSEPGVLNLTWLLERDDEHVFILSITLNDTKQAVKDDEAIGLAMRAIELLAKEDHK